VDLLNRNLMKFSKRDVKVPFVMIKEIF